MSGTAVDYRAASAIDRILADVAGRRCDAGRLAALRPEVSVVIPVYNCWANTRACLFSLLRIDLDLSLQVIVVDDASFDETSERLSGVPGVDIVHNGLNLGFGRSCNRGAAIAAAPLIYFLNNDTMLSYGSLQTLVDRMREDPAIGIAGSKLIYPDGRLQEAGGIVWSDAAAYNFGRFDPPDNYEYSFARDVDYVSGASLIVRSDLFRSVNGFDDRFAPAYYEDTDLCFAARERGFRVVYEPRSLVVHYEGLTSGPDFERGVKRFQEVNRAKFLEKWAETLARDHSDSRTADVARATRRRGLHERSILFIDEAVPGHDRSSGAQRLWRLIEGFQSRGYRVAFFPDDLAPAQPYTKQLQRRGVEVVYDTSSHERNASDLLRAAASSVDVVWISRMAMCRKYLPRVRSSSSAAIIYDTVDLAHVRLRRQAAYDPLANDSTWREWEQVEKSCALAADATATVTADEAKILSAAGADRVTVVSNVHDPAVIGSRTYANTSGLLFIGSYDHRPNVDAATWLLREIMPLVWARRPDIHLTLLGASPPPEVTALIGNRVTVPGYVPDVEPAFLAARIFVAPLRYGAGIKGKIGHALSYALPVVTTAVGAEGFGLRHLENAMIADSPTTFADAILTLYESETLWTRIAAHAFTTLEPFRSSFVMNQAIELVDLAILPAS